MRISEPLAANGRQGVKTAHHGHQKYPFEGRFSNSAAHVEIIRNGVVNYCYPAEICLAALEYYAFDAGPNCQTEARDNFRLLAGSKLRELIYSQLGYDP